MICKLNECNNKILCNKDICSKHHYLTVYGTCTTVLCDMVCNGTDGLCSYHRKNKGRVRTRFGDYYNKASNNLRWCYFDKHLVDKNNFRKRKSGSEGLDTICKDCVKFHEVKIKYKLNKNDVLKMLNDCNNQCIGCQSEFVNNNFLIDHNHQCCSGRNSCGKCVRGLLCAGCNTGIGFLQDDVVRMKNLVTYLENFS